MIRFLDDYYIGRMRQNFNKILSIKKLYDSKIAKKFYKKELSFDEAIETYLYILKFKQKLEITTQDEDYIMKDYFINNHIILGKFIKDISIYDGYYEDNEELDDIYDVHCNMTGIIANLFRTLFPDKRVEVASMYEMVYEFNTNTFTDETREIFIEDRQFYIDTFGNYEDSQDEEETEEFNSSFQEAVQCDSNTIAICDVIVQSSCVEIIDLLNYFLPRNSNGGFFGSAHYYDDKFFLDITTDLPFSYNINVFILLAIFLYKFEKEEL